MISRRSLLLSIPGVALPAAARVGQVEIGVCGTLDDFDNAEKFGFDYFEPAAAAVAALSQPEFDAFARRVMQSRIRCTRFNSFIRTLQVVGPAVDRDALSAYVSSTLDRCRALGGRIIVWGSAGSRNVPDGFSRDEAWRQIRAFLKLAGEIAQPKQMLIAIEPLRRQESNILNTGEESLKMVREVDHPAIKMIIDYYHLREEKEDPSILQRARDAIVHLHFANPNGRLWPRDLSEDPLYRQFFRLIKSTAYRAAISIEGKGTFNLDAAPALTFFRKALT